MVNEESMSHGNDIACTRTAIFASFTELLQGLVADAFSRNEPGYLASGTRCPRPFAGLSVFGLV